MRMLHTLEQGLDDSAIMRIKDTKTGFGMTIATDGGRISVFITNKGKYEPLLSFKEEDGKYSLEIDTATVTNNPLFDCPSKSK